MTPTHRLKNADVEAHHVELHVDRPEWACDVLAYEGDWIVLRESGDVFTMPDWGFTRIYEPAPAQPETAE